MKKKLTLNVEEALIKKAKKKKLNLSAIMDHALADRLGMKAKGRNSPDLVVKVSCPKCRAVRTTSTLKRVSCFKCGYVFKVCPKNDTTRIVGIVKGSMELLHKRQRLV